MQVQKLSTGRREFLKRSARGIVSASTLSLVAAHTAWAQAHNRGVNPNANVSRGYGPLAPTPDQNGEAILALPAGFSFGGSRLQVPAQLPTMSNCYCFPGRAGGSLSGAWSL